MSPIELVGNSPGVLILFSKSLIINSFKLEDGKFNLNWFLVFFGSNCVAEDARGGVLVPDWKGSFLSMFIVNPEAPATPGGVGELAGTVGAGDSDDEETGLMVK